MIKRRSRCAAARARGAPTSSDLVHPSPLCFLQSLGSGGLRFSRAFGSTAVVPAMSRIREPSGETVFEDEEPMHLNDLTPDSAVWNYWRLTNYIHGSVRSARRLGRRREAEYLDRFGYILLIFWCAASWEAGFKECARYCRNFRVPEFEERGRSVERSRNKIRRRTAAGEWLDGGRGMARRRQGNG